MAPTEKRGLRSLPCKHPRLELSRMTLYLIPMCFDTAKEICTTMHVQHNAVLTGIMRFPDLLPLIVLTPHLNPFTLKVSRRPSPLPPILPTYSINPFRTEALDDYICSRCQILVGDIDSLRPCPGRAGDPLAAKFLDVLDGVLSGEGKKFAQDMKRFIVGEVDSGFIVKRLPV